MRLLKSVLISVVLSLISITNGQPLGVGPGPVAAAPIGGVNPQLAAEGMNFLNNLVGAAANPYAVGGMPNLMGNNPYNQPNINPYGSALIPIGMQAGMNIPQGLQGIQGMNIPQGLQGIQGIQGGLPFNQAMMMQNNIPLQGGASIPNNIQAIPSIQGLQQIPSAQGLNLQGMNLQGMNLQQMGMNPVGGLNFNPNAASAAAFANNNPSNNMLLGNMMGNGLNNPAFVAPNVQTFARPDLIPVANSVPTTPVSIPQLTSYNNPVSQPGPNAPGTPSSFNTASIPTPTTVSTPVRRT